MELKDFAVGQKWKTRGGSEVVISSVNGSPDYPIRGKLDECSFSWAASGHFQATDAPTSDDLMEIIEAPGQSAIVKELIEKAECYEAEAKRVARHSEQARENAAQYDKAAEEYRALAAEYRRVAAVA
jgi:hypothetical protein